MPLGKMNKEIFYKAIIIIVLIGIGLLAGILNNKIRSFKPGNQKDMVAYNNANGIEVTATLIGSSNNNPEVSELQKKYPLNINTLIEISLTAHEGDLKTFNLVSGSKIKDSAGQIISPAKWEETNPDSHHRAGYLIFPKINNPDILIINGLGNVTERSLKW